jgi:hypothetical protein
MITTGDINQFAIQYRLIPDEYFDYWGELGLLIEGQDVCAYEWRGEPRRYRGNLMDISEWFRENLKCILDFDEFPFPVEGETALELIERSKYTGCDVDDWLDWLEQFQPWLWRHSWFRCRGGGFLPDVLFRTPSPHDKRVEICWDNSSIYSDEEIVFCHPKGMGYVDQRVFKDVISTWLCLLPLDFGQLANESSFLTGVKPE